VCCLYEGLYGTGDVCIGLNQSECCIAVSVYGAAVCWCGVGFNVCVIVLHSDHKWRQI
jgi:hypothetical protein